jgi:hypothetical protein
MDIKFSKIERNYHTFSELDYGTVFIPVCDNDTVCMKCKMEANGKTKAVRLSDGFIYDIDGHRYVQPYYPTLNIKVEK